MMTDYTSWLSHPIARGALSGFLAAILIDVNEFRKWKNWEEASAYDWRLASWRWVQGVVAGAIGSLGVEVIT